MDGSIARTCGVPAGQVVKETKNGPADLPESVVEVVNGQVVVEEGSGRGEVGLGQDAWIDEAASHETTDGLVHGEGFAVDDAVLFGPQNEVGGAGHRPLFGVDCPCWGAVVEEATRPGLRRRRLTARGA